jgi:HEXXH motif-containing protein
VTTATPWQWTPDFGPWLDSIARRAADWEPAVDLQSDDEPRRLVADAAKAGAAWLYHPCVGAITHAHAEGRLERDVVLIAWLALHAELQGELVLSTPLWCWSDTGGALLEAGTHSLDTIGAAVAPAEATPEIALDPWCSVLGYAYPDSIPAGGRPDAEQEAEVRRSTLIGLRSQALLGGYLPEVADWLTSLAKVLVFLDASENLSRSASAADLPGIVFADATSELALLEVLVHEASHHLLFLTEAGGALVDPTEERRFASPLRPDPRPLRGILLAYHALAFMCAFYKDLERSPLGAEVVDAADVVGLREKMADAEATLDSAATSFTERGADFMTATRAVARYAA